MKIKISLAQINLTLGNIDQNFCLAESMVTKAAGKNSQIILFPELWSCGYDLPAREQYSLENEKLIPHLSSLAHASQIWLGGSLLIKQGGQFFNRFYLFSPDGASVVQYDKIHLFHMMNEHQWFTPGNKIQIASFPWGLTGLATCYDLRFPELFRQQALSGVKLILLVSQWPIQRIEHWKILLRARAIENQVFIAAVNSVGPIGEVTYGGSSAVISPWGETLVEGTCSEQELLFTELDMDQVERIRNKIPVFKDRRSDLY